MIEVSERLVLLPPGHLRGLFLGACVFKICPYGGVLFFFFFHLPWPQRSTGARIRAAHDRVVPGRRSIPAFRHRLWRKVKPSLRKSLLVFCLCGAPTRRALSPIFNSLTFFFLALAPRPHSLSHSLPSRHLRPRSRNCARSQTTQKRAKSGSRTRLSIYSNGTLSSARRTSRPLSAQRLCPMVSCGHVGWE